MTASCVASRACQLAGDAALAHDEDAVAHVEDLRQLRRDHQDRHAVGGELVHQAVDLGFGADVDAARRLVHDQDLRVQRQPLGDDDLLLIAAGEVEHLLLDRRRAHAQRVDHPPRQRPLRAEAHDAEAAQPVEERERQVLADGQTEDQRLQLAIFRHQPDAEPDRVARRADADRLAVDEDLAAVVLVGAEDGARDLGAARADQPGQPDDLAGADAERDVLEHDRRRILTGAGAAETAHLEHRRRRALGEALQTALGLFRPEEVPQGTADHQPDDAVGRRLGDRQLAGELAVAQDRDPIADGEDLLEAVRDVDDRQTARLEPADDLEQRRRPRCRSGPRSARP